MTRFGMIGNQFGKVIAATLLFGHPSNEKATRPFWVGGESMMAEKFSAPELSALRSELLQGFDSKDCAELLQLFLMGRGYGVSAEDARSAVSKVGMAGNTLEAFQRELESIARVM